MNVFKQSNVKTLSEWLEVATRKLEETAKERIRREVDAHFAEAVEAYREEGQSESEAQAGALKDLGDARMAARRFRREHLTERDVRKLKNVEKRGRSVAFLVFNNLSFLGMFGVDFPRTMRTYYWPWFFLILEAYVLLVLPIWCFIVLKHSNPKAKRNLLLLQSMSGYAFGSFVGLLFDRDNSFKVRFWLAALGLFLLTSFLRNLRLRNKLGKTRMDYPAATTSEA